MNEKIVKFLKHSRTTSGYTQQQVADMIGMKKNTISNYENGVSEPDIDIFAKLCKIYNSEIGSVLENVYGSDNNVIYSIYNHIFKKYVSLDEHGKNAVNAILEVELKRMEALQEENEVIKHNTRYIEYYNLPVSAGTGVYLDSDDKEMIEIPLTVESSKADFLLRVSGDSMEPLYFDSDLILVQSAPTICEGEFGIFIIDDEAFFKKCGKQQLISLNPKYPDINLNEYTNIRCKGKVLGKVLT